MILYNGSVSIIEKPFYHGSKVTNNYGYGFYCTENIDLAKELACVNENQETNLKKIRMVSGLSQQKLAISSGVELRSIQMYE